MNPEIQAWKERWRRVNQFEIDELRATPLDVKFRQLAALMASVDSFGWRESLEADDAAGYDRWQRLRQAYAHREERRS
jgi:hypothetical protein